MTVTLGEPGTGLMGGGLSCDTVAKTAPRGELRRGAKTSAACTKTVVDAPNAPRWVRFPPSPLPGSMRKALPAGGSACWFRWEE